MITTADILRRMGACADAITWAADYPDPATAWAACPHGDWLLWLLDRDVWRPPHAMLADIVELATGYAAPVARDLPCWPAVRDACSAVVTALRSGNIVADWGAEAAEAARDAARAAGAAGAWAAARAARSAARAAGAWAGAAGAWAAARAAGDAGDAAGDAGAWAAIANIVRKHCDRPANEYTPPSSQEPQTK